MGEGVERVRAFVEGVFAGLGIAVPVGAIAVLIVDLAIRQGFVSAIPAAMGAASADLAYAAVAAIGGIAVASALEPYERSIKLLGAVVLMAIVAGRIVRARRSTPERPDRRSDRPLPVFGLFVGLTLANPLTIVYFAALILGLSADVLASSTDRLLFVGGAFVASAGWQLCLAGVGALLHHRLPVRASLITSVLGNTVIAALALRMAIGA